MAVNLRDIAKRAGVSPATVSRVINAHPQVSEATRLRVLEAVEELDYPITTPRPRTTTPENRTLSLIVPDVSTPFYCAILQGVEQEAFARQFDLILYTTQGRSQQNVVTRIATGMNTSGVIVVTPRHEEDQVLRDIGANIPVVIVDHRATGSGFPHVTVDNLRASYEAVSYLLKQRHTRIGFISGPLEVESAKDRLRGYRLALEEAGFPYDEGLVLRGDFAQATGYRLLMEYGADREMPDAWFCSNDLMAAGAIEALKEQGFSVPGDVAVMGFDDLPIANLLNPSLTTVKQPIQEMGETAIRVLLRLIDGEELESPRIILSTKLVVRESA